MSELNGRLREVYDFISAYINKNGFSPSVREVCKGVGLRSPSSAHTYMDKLCEQGYIQKGEGTMRTVSLTNYTSGTRVPIMGRVTAGLPILAVEDVTGYVYYTGAANGDFFALRVKGDSMINVGILDEDIVIVRQQETADNGDIVVAMLEGEATVKRLHIDGKYVWLMPENEAYLPIRGSSCTILGKVIALSREY